MIKIRVLSKPSPEEFEAIVKGMRNPMNSWKKSDYLGGHDQNLMFRLLKAGPDHRKFMRMMNVILDIEAPLYW